MNKKGQFYIFLALLLLVFIAGLRPSGGVPTSTDSTFTQSRLNFIHEAGYVINSAIYEGEEIVDALDEYIEDYQDYMQAQNINVTLIYFLAQNDDLTIKSYYDRAVTATLVYDDGETEADIQYLVPQTLKRTDVVEVSIDGPTITEEFTLSLDGDKHVDLEVVYKFII